MQFKNLTPLATILACTMLLSACQLLPGSTSQPSESTQPATTQQESQAKMGKQLTTTTTYSNPGGSDDVGFTLQVDSNGVIVDAKTDVLAVNTTSKMRQEAFAKDFPAAVKGKKLSELSSIDRVGGSSLTTKAFNESLAKLKAQL